MASGIRTASLVGADQVARNLKKFGADYDKAVGRAVNKAAQTIRTHAVRSIQRGPASGEVYEKFSPDRTHQASAPGEAPQTDTGALASSVAVRQAGKHTARVGTGIDYGRYLEFGTQRIAERPWLRPAAKEGEKVRDRELADAFEAAVRGIQK